MAENQLSEIEEARAFAQAIIDTVREPVLVLDQDLRVITASRSFYRTFKVGPEDTEGRLLYELGRWSLGHSEASLAPGKDRTRERRDGGL